MNNADKFKQIFDLYATELWAMSEKNFLSWLNAERDVPDRKVGKWIPCKKQMPKPNEVVGNVAKYYLVQTEYGDMMVACYNAEGDARWWEQMYQYGAIMDEIVAWMELPEEYKEGGEDEHSD